MRAVVWNAPETLELVELPDPVAEDGAVLIDVARCGICGSDLHSYSKGFAAKPGQVLGHEVSGRVLEAPGVAELAPGDRVTVRPLIPCGACPGCVADHPQLCEGGLAGGIGYGLRGGFAERLLVPRAVVGETIFPLPETVDDSAGALVEPLAVALHAVGLSGAGRGDTAVVLGAGMIGLGVVRLLKLAGAETIVAVDPSPLRRARALELGAHVAVDPLVTDTVDAGRGVTGPGALGRGARAGVALDGSRARGTFDAAVDPTRRGGTIVLAAARAA